MRKLVILSVKHSSIFNIYLLIMLNKTMHLLVNLTFVFQVGLFQARRHHHQRHTSEFMRGRKLRTMNKEKFLLLCLAIMLSFPKSNVINALRNMEAQPSLFITTLTLFGLFCRAQPSTKVNFTRGHKRRINMSPILHEQGAKF